MSSRTSAGVANNSAARTNASASATTPLDQLVRARVASLSYLPTTAAVAMKFMELGRNPEADPADYATVIGSDAALSGKILGLANSSWFGVRNRVTKPQVAVSLLGLGTIRTLAISYCLTGLHNDLALTPDESQMFWSSSLCRAVAAKQFAAHFDPSLAEEAFACGVFQDFAVPLMYSLAKEPVLGWLHDASLDAATRMQRERDLFGHDHAEIARMMAQKLELPELFVDVLAFHHSIKSLHEFVSKPELADAAYVASLFPQDLGSWNRADAETLKAFVAQRTKDNPMDPDLFIESVQLEYDQLCAYFEPSAAEATKTSLAQLLAEATKEVADNTTRLVASVQQLLSDVAMAGKAADEMLQEHDALTHMATTDSLTQTRNREGFMADARLTLSKAQRYGIGYAIAYLDVDRFKPLNDTAGHIHGDRALQHAARAMLENVRREDLVARLGGDEFVILLNDVSSEHAAQILERIVSAARTPAADRPKNAPALPTLSAGLLFVAPRSPALPLETLLAMADALMYQSKRAGGNRVTSATPETAPKVQSA
jgi:diguanylate cyclase (GGDEF)-like protein